MENVQIPQSSTFKFILIKGNDNYYIFGDILPYHSDLFDKFLQLYPGNFEVQGGGKMIVENLKVRIFGKSDNYGPFDKKNVNQLMEKYCKKKKLKLEVE